MVKNHVEIAICPTNKWLVINSGFSQPMGFQGRARAT